MMRIPAKTAKYKNIKSGGYDSKREKKRAMELKILRMAGDIQCLREQVKFELIPSQRGSDGKVIERAVTYTADFVYERGGKVIVEDAKGIKTPVYVVKRKMMLFFHGIRVVEV
ncbi:MAG: DUF1064 domain-containing protein [Gammaproteobacteria bacterium]|nr:DUF1064 domain-containing protein [Gammaproteobacteria bacterium]MDP2346830.1 DUF1064 domain-containing protein [Gammaproteobacteria bacterium]